MRSAKEVREYFRNLDGTQKLAYMNVLHAANFIVGGLENTIEDEPECSNDYKEAKLALSNRNALIRQVEKSALTETYGPGYVSDEPLKAARFAGCEFIHNVADMIVADMGY